MEAYIAEWLGLGFRWLHFVAGVAWVGASFYFNWLDHSVRAPAPGSNPRIDSELWSIHGGAIYHNQKYLQAPETMPAELHWFKWEAYTTWMSGMGLMAVIYWWGANTYLIDRSVMALSVPTAIALSVGSIAGGWILYDQICKRMESDRWLSVVICVLLVAASWGLFQVFGGRAAYIHVGVIMATIMVANVLFVVMPGHQRMLDAMTAGTSEQVDSGFAARRRSLHNNYFTLPVLFIMISNHFPMTYGHPHGWALLMVIGGAGALIRHFFNLRNAGRTVPALPAVAAAMLVALAVIIAPRPAVLDEIAGSAPEFTQIQAILDSRCTACHAERPTQPGFVQPAGGIMLETRAQIEAAAQRIYRQAVATRAMPLGNITGMTDAERELLGLWIARELAAE